MPTPQISTFEQLKNFINENLPDNISGVIDPLDIRTSLLRLIDTQELNNAILYANFSPEQTEVWNSLIDKLEQIQIGNNLGLIKTTDTPPATGKYRGDVATAGTYTNFKNSEGVALVFTQGELDINFGFIYVAENVAEKILSAKIKGSDKTILSTIASGNFTLNGDNAFYGIGENQDVSFYLEKGKFIEIVLHSGSISLNGVLITAETAVLQNNGGYHYVYTKSGVTLVTPHIPTPLNIRYIRDTIAGGNSINGAALWEEIQAFKNGVNVALNKPVLANFSPSSGMSPLSNITNGNINGELIGRTDLGNWHVVVDLGTAQYLDEIKVWHYYIDGRFFNDYKLEVSEDATTWFTIYKSSVNGTYNESISGKSHTNLQI